MGSSGAAFRVDVLRLEALAVLAELNDAQLEQLLAYARALAGSGPHEGETSAQGLPEEPA